MTLALIAGTGDLPPALVENLPVAPLICALDGNQPDLKADLHFRLEHLGSFLETLKARGVTEICMAGTVRRPSIDPGAINDATKPLVPTIMAALSSGDDGALRAVIGLFEDAGFAVRAAHEIAPDLLPPAGVLVGRLSENAAAQARVGDQTVSLMGRADLGQACIIRQGRVLVQEDEAGTDEMILQLKTRDAVTRQTTERGIDARDAVLFKAPKPDQDRRADLPVIGPDTARLSAAAGLSGLIIEARGVMVLHRADVIRILNESDMFLWVRERGAL